MLANVADVVVLSIYPWLGAHARGYPSMMEMRRLYNRQIFPKYPRLKLPAIAIMWTRADGHRNARPNHFVPLVP